MLPEPNISHAPRLPPTQNERKWRKHGRFVYFDGLVRIEIDGQVTWLVTGRRKLSKSVEDGAVIGQLKMERGRDEPITTLASTENAQCWRWCKSAAAPESPWVPSDVKL